MQLHIILTEGGGNLELSDGRGVLGDKGDRGSYGNVISIPW